MPATNPFLIFTDRLNQLGARYMVTGSVASMAYGEPRLTHDVDIVIEISREHCQRFGDLFPGEDLRDIEGILAVSAAAIDFAALERNIDLLGARAAWAKVRRPPQ